HHNAGSSGYDFSETGEIENRIRRHRFALRLDGARAVSLAPDDTGMTTDQYYRPRQFFLLDRIPDDGVHPRQALGGHADARRSTLRKIDTEGRTRERADQEEDGGVNTLRRISMCASSSKFDSTRSH